MKSSLDHDASPGRPLEIELPTNRLIVHPLARALAGRLAQTPVTPNQVSVSSVAAALAAAICYGALPWPWGPPAGLGFQLLWHVLDGADGDLARRTGRASPVGELIDGVCDHLSQGLIYVALAVILGRTLGWAAWIVAGLAAASHALQANAYETGRKTYAHWVRGADWMRHAADRSSPLKALAAGVYLKGSALFSPGESGVAAAMGAARSRGPAWLSRARDLYRARMAPLVRQSGALGGNGRTLATFASLMLGTPLWFFIYEIGVLNLVLLVVLSRRRRINRDLASALERA